MITNSFVSSYAANCISPHVCQPFNIFQLEKQKMCTLYFAKLRYKHATATMSHPRDNSDMYNIQWRFFSLWKNSQ